MKRSEFADDPASVSCATARLAAQRSQICRCTCSPAASSRAAAHWTGVLTDRYVSAISSRAFNAESHPGPLATIQPSFICGSPAIFERPLSENVRTCRGRASVWKLWGVNQAINAGAALEALVTRAVIDLLPPRHVDRLRPALSLLSESMLALCRGQVLDLQFEQRVDVSIDEYLEMIGLKTAALFECAARLGGVAAGVGEASLEKAGKFGYHLGIAFQVIDDIVGVWGSTTQTGKPVGSDLKNGKKTLPTLIALKGGAAGNRRVLRSLLTRARFTAAEMETARAIIGQSNAEVVCRRQAAEHLAEARLQLFGMTDRPNWAVRALAEMVTTLESSLV